MGTPMHTLLAALILLLPSIGYALPGHTWVVSIGNNQGEGNEVQLLYAQRDAEAVTDVLRRLGGVSSNRIVRIINEDADTVRNAMIKVVGELAAVPAGEPTALVVYYSGHADADTLHMDGTRLPFHELRQLVTSAPATARLLIVDACRSGGISRVKGARAAKTFKLDVVESTTEGMAIITSSAADESSQESDRLRGSFFSHHLVNALRGAADRNGDGEVTLAEAYGYTYDETIRSSGETLELQHPTYSWNVKGRGELVLTQLGHKDRRSGTVQLSDPVVYIVGDVRGGGLVAEVRPHKSKASLSLPPRRYRIQQRRAREYLNYEFDLEAGAQLKLDDLPSRAIRYDRLVRKGGGDRRVVQGIMLMGGGRGEILDGEGATPHLVLGYNADLERFSIGARLRGASGTLEDTNGRAPRRHDELGLMLVLQRFIDVEWASFAFGLTLEAAAHRQTFTDDSHLEVRETGSLAFGLLAASEVDVGGGYSLRIEGGPLTTLLRAGEAELGVEVDTELKSPLAWWAAAGVVWRF